MPNDVINSIKIHIHVSGLSSNVHNCKTKLLGFNFWHTKVVLAIIIGVTLPVNVAPNSVRKVRVDVQVLQFLFRRVPGSRGSFAKNGTCNPIALDGLMLDLAAFRSNEAIKSLGPCGTLFACVNVNALSIKGANLEMKIGVSLKCFIYEAFRKMILNKKLKNFS